ncbi:MAG: hypothetical protein A3J09_01400 [Candidatus Zambryskibacteria bacterium RIFCSPLOWO2_02_FULL_51_21]|uniref:Uncharacterized protein n=1 Tax=Candidatus Zambryskibacteria bacterium RIFCSPHIGHO2_02_FULL_43_37 TaxID=1802749 RepID=A0A1G2TGW7_9BACT|nr:MAG: hypothetical protein A2723_01400 [Candidatus Zambryskibacteria bacterium RIFCSPHIGHO2_01_FULL_52_18]OHA96530.1 MAG: hypothetical protein A3D49_01500 [Candidatus Zambryskibacteria bacterium RIFCSPHIGHO2_02_FULL_43_37]OHB07198.1 MAG: hypothetical protein A2944_01270 [Candidatus Zambryskibacteria bacterium RIFCSPLOWO2_01_FULL_52_12]OHB11206.1 MAG: hypothetical protein A3J09_01400 [Candidatus Zambryskibacteria bacterium RIFCSPLOWO2_02_FULL_51_21]
MEFQAGQLIVVSCSENGKKEKKYWLDAFLPGAGELVRVKFAGEEEGESYTLDQMLDSLDSALGMRKLVALPQPEDPSLLFIQHIQ